MGCDTSDKHDSYQNNDNFHQTFHTPVMVENLGITDRVTVLVMKWEFIVGTASLDGLEV